MADLPELFGRCPKAVKEDRGLGRWSWFCQCHGTGLATLVPVLFDEAVERMARFEFKRSPWHNSAKVTWETADEWERQKYLVWAAESLRAAIGGETE